MLRTELGINLKYLMMQKNITFSQLSRLSGVNRDHLYHITNGTKEIGIDTIEKLCGGLGITPSEFFNFRNIENQNEINKKILTDFKNLAEGYWDFVDCKTDALIHSIHPYPAVMIYPISRTIISIVSKYKKINTLLDPFEGSGTVVVEGQLANIENVIGNDLNPLANLIARAKTTLLTKQDFESINKIKQDILSISNKCNKEIKKFAVFVLNNYSITSKDNWAINASKITNEYFSDSNYKKLFIVPYIKNLGFWFRPETLPQIFAIKHIIDNYHLPDNSFLYCTLSETIRFVSNTRNGEFKLYRMTEKSIMSKYYDVFDIFVKNLEKNVIKEREYLEETSTCSNVKHTIENCKELKSIKDSSVDLVITSPPYGDSHTTVAYGQFSRLSNDLLNLTQEKNVDSILLGGKKIKEKSIKLLGSQTLSNIYNDISKIDEKRANEVLDFYCDLDETIKTISKKTKTFGYQFWVVGNRTVKKINIPTDQIIIELANKYNLTLLDRYYRKISNKVMPSVNSPTNVSGECVATMNNEIIIFLQKRPY